MQVSGSPDPQAGILQQQAERLAGFVQQHAPVMILSGAGISTDSGIPDYRDSMGNWKRKQPVQHQDFLGSHATRQRYWARSLIGWPVIQNASPNAAHFYIATLESCGLVNQVVTQNVDRLHQKAGSDRVIDLHGRADEIICMSCDFRESRSRMHERCAVLNPGFSALHATVAPDGDADLEVDFSDFQIPPCPQCGGIVKPDVVFFGDNVPRNRVDQVLENLQASRGLLVVGSSLMVFSGFRFCREAHRMQTPLAILTKGVTRADDLATLKLDYSITDTLQHTLNCLGV